MISAPRQAEFTWSDLISLVVTGAHLTSAQTSWVMEEVMAGNANPVALGGLLVALRSKGETVDEVLGLADTMHRHALPTQIDPDAVDIVGTGGDRHRTVNISTMASLVAAGAGVRVVKHGNRAASSASGSADVLEALGVRLDLHPDEAARVAQEVGITFLFAQVYHPSFRHAAVTRRDLGVATAFNILGPLTNPAQPRAAAIGVGDARMAPIVAGVLAQRGTSAIVFRSEDGLDELSTTAPARLWQVGQGSVIEHEFDTATFGFARATLEDLRGGSADQNAAAAHELLGGATGPIRDTVIVNAAAGLVAHGSLSGTGAGNLTDRFAAGIEAASTSIDSGAAAEVLTRWVRATQVGTHSA